MSKHLQRDMDLVHRELLSLSAMVEEMIDRATRALTAGEDVLDEILEADRQVDRREVRIEDECLKILALHQPVAVDLRRIATVIKVNNDLERIGDLALNIAERSKYLMRYPAFRLPDRVPAMVKIAVSMVHGSLDAFVNMDANSARQICLTDDEVDQMCRDLTEEITAVMESDSNLVAAGLQCFSAVRQVERIADHATNIAEDVIYLVEGEIVRHPNIASSAAK